MTGKVRTPTRPEITRDLICRVKAARRHVTVREFTTVTQKRTEV
ncbi:hypothetical protein ABZ023_18970 [Streptomyces sp. NPDC006367]